jgi:alkylhydroperoxidase family enzyme
LLSLADFDNSVAFSAVQKLALRYSTALTGTPVIVPEDLFARLKEHFTSRQLVELTSAIAWENYWSRFNHAFGVAPEGTPAEAVCLLPAGPRPGA